MGQSLAVTSSVQVEVHSRYVAEQSRPADDYYFFAYKITISNLGERQVQLLDRHWFITHGDGRLEEVQGAGVVGKTPRLEPGESFEYTSFCPLETPRGQMQGRYGMVGADGERFAVEVAPFALEMPHDLH